MTKEKNNDFLNSIFDHIISIAKGKCTISDEYIYSHESESEQKVLEGLLFLHQDLELYKVELRDAMETEYKLKMLEEKNKQLEQFNYAASHDLKEPLRTISSFSSLILRTNKDNLNESGKEYLNYVVDASHRMWDLINGLSNYTQIGRKQKIEEVNVGNLVDNICVDLAAQIKERKVDFQISELPNISGYGLELRRLFQNLISNALKFNREGIPQIIKIQYERIEEGHLFSIEDNGIGIAEHHYDKIFEIFKRLNHKEEFEGTGVGLALCRRIVLMHYGRIWVESELGEGTKFLFIISDKINQ